MTSTEQQPDSYALTIATKPLFKNCSSSDLQYGVKRFGLPGMFELSRVANVYPEKELSDVIAYFRDDEAGRRIDNKYGMLYLQEELNKQDVSLPEEMFSLLSVYDKEWIACEEQREQVPQYLQELFSKIREQEDDTRGYNSFQKRLTNQDLQTIDRLITTNVHAQEPLERFCDYDSTPTTNTSGVFNVSLEDSLETEPNLTRFGNKTISYETFDFLHNQGYHEDDVELIGSLFGEKTIPLLWTIQELEEDPIRVINILQQSPSILEESLESIERYIRNNITNNY